MKREDRCKRLRTRPDTESPVKGPLPFSASPRASPFPVSATVCQALLSKPGRRPPCPPGLEGGWGEGHWGTGQVVTLGALLPGHSPGVALPQGLSVPICEVGTTVPTYGNV